MGRVWLLAQEGSAKVEFRSGENLALLAIMAVCLLALVDDLRIAALEGGGSRTSFWLRRGPELPPPLT